MGQLDHFSSQLPKNFKKKGGAAAPKITGILELLGEWKRVFETDKVVIGGDFNLVPDKWIDRYPPKGQSHNYEDIITKFIANGDLIDFLRSNNSDSRQYTWFNSANNGQCSRLDYWLLSTNLISKVRSCFISRSPLTDHCAIFISLQLFDSKH
ncbi:hypothetical protein DNTS_000580, partial [Danionella cerebrum]